MSRNFFVVFLFSFLFAVPVRAKVLINEISIEPLNEQWIEVFNDSEENIDLSGWILDDNGGAEKYVFPKESTIGARIFFTVQSGKLNLNKSSSDSARLFDQNNVLIDSMDYNKSLGVDMTIGRLPDKKEIWGICQPTKNKENICITSSPSFSPTSTMTNIPTNSPMPLPKPKATKTPIPVVKSELIEPENILSPTSSLQPQSNSQILTAIETVATKTVAITLKPSTYHTPPAEFKPELTDKKFSIFPFLLVVLSVFFLVAGMSLFYTTKDESRNFQKRTSNQKNCL